METKGARKSDYNAYPLPIKAAAKYGLSQPLPFTTLHAPLSQGKGGGGEKFDGDNTIHTQHQLQTGQLSKYWTATESTISKS